MTNKLHIKLSLLALLAFFIVMPDARAASDDFRKSTIEITVVNKKGRLVKKGNLHIEQTANEFLFGANSSVMNSEAHYNSFVSIFNAVNFLGYWSQFDGGNPGSYNPTKIAEALYIMNLLHDRGKLYLSGHPILYNLNSVQPSWINASNQMKEYRSHLQWWIKTFNKIQVADIVNEHYHHPIPDIFAPYQWTKDIKPGLKRRINEYGLLTSEITDPYIKQLKANLDKFDVIGIQAHVSAAPSAMPSDAMILQNLNKLAALGKPIHITEVSVPSSTYGWTEKSQSEYLIRLYTLFFNHPAVEMISYWDVSDNNAWNVSSGLWRKDDSPKPVWAALTTLITKTLRTNVTVKIPSNGKITFTGYRGTYTINGKEFILDGKTRSWTVVK